MRSFFFILLFIVSTQLLSCSASEESDKVTLIKSEKELNFLLDSLTPNYTIPDGCSSIKLNNKNVLVYYNRLRYTLLFFDIQNHRLVHSIQYKKDGIFPINHIMGIKTMNKDSIFLLPAYIKRLYISDWSGKIYRVFDLLKDRNIEESWQNEPSGQIDIISKKCIMVTTPYGDQNKPTQYYKTPLGAVFDLQSEKMAVNFISYPDVYQHGEKWGFYHAMISQCINNKGEIIVSFPLDPNICLYDKDYRLVKTTLASCKQFSAHISPFKDTDDVERYCYNEDKYEQIIYDKYRKIYYRFATKGVSGKEPASSKMLYKGLYKPLYIIILDKNLKKIGEVQLPKNKHYFLNNFITEDGLYLSNSHPENPNRRENELSFTCYKLIDNQ